MKKTEKNLYLLYMLFAVGLITANCIAGKLFILPFKLFGENVTITSGVICYPLTFLITDIIGEIWGKKEAGYAVRFGFICQLVSTFIIIVARYLPAVDANVQGSYVALLGQNVTFVAASLAAYICSQRWDVFMFHHIRDRYIRKYGSTKGGKWIWNNGSTMSSQFIDSIVYVLVAFGIGFGWLSQPHMYVAMLNMTLAQWLIKVVLAAIDTPFFYWFTRERVRR